MKTDTNYIQKAIVFASKKHVDQKRDDGDPFILHPMRVAGIVNMVVGNDDDNLVAAAWLHDTVEDTETTYEELIREFNQDIADLVMEVTHEGNKSTGYYFPRLKTQRGIMLKFADRLSNVSDMNSWTDERKQHYLDKSKFWRSE
jgi:(p)ppGpp synthase/HD superfamily hydrolase